ncbi:ASCH domain-containing protein [Pectobacterium polonicum]|uniref:ASCH domain-containing protein n=1 Tax=Pectobacterium polonicum TaxID=2485124 RepID=UPI0010F4ADC7|nr:ASCH domain-containing protein [Pectobacterium polonicum]TKY81796.1 ASCH domain-containing protein [Pectobacterium polonicum]
MKALSIRQPWAWLIVNGYKDIENRTWNTKYRGPVLIHASSRKPTKAEVEEARKVLMFSHGVHVSVRMPDPEHYKLGGIVGVATITGTCESSSSPWFFGPVGYQLRDSRPLKFRPLRGRLSFFDTPWRLHGRFNLLVHETYRDKTEGTL